MKRLATFTLTLMFSGMTFASTSSAFHNYHSGHYTSAKKEIIALAQKGNREALYYLANMYLYGRGINKNPEKGLGLMVQSAKLNYVPALMFMGKYNFYQLKDISKALPWFKQAGYAGNTNAQLFTLIAYTHGFGTKINYDKARWSILQMAKRGNALAQYQLGYMFMMSKHSKNRKLGLLWMKKSAAHGYPKAIELLKSPIVVTRKVRGRTYSTITRLKKNDESEIQLQQSVQYQQMQKALAEAKATLYNIKPVSGKNGEIAYTPKVMELTKKMVLQPDYHLLKPNDIPISKISIDMLHMHYVNQEPTLAFPKYEFTLPSGAENYNDALQMLLKRAVFGDALVLYKLGQIYEEGLGVDKDPKKSFYYYSKSAKQNYLRAQYKMGVFYLQGNAIATNTEIAISWLARAALRGSAPAQFILGTIYEYGINKPGENGYIKRNTYQAKALYSISSYFNVGEAKYRLAQLYANGTLNPDQNLAIERKNQRLAYELYRSAAKQDIKEANLGLAYYYAAFSKNKADLKKSYEIADDEADEHNQSAKFLLALLYDRGIGVTKDQGEAIDIYQQLAKKGNAIAQFMLGTYEYINVDNKQQAVYWLQKSAQKGNPYAQYNLAILSRKNEFHHVGENFASLLKKSARNHFPQANLLLADHYLMQNSSAREVKQAVAIYQKLAKKQDSRAELKLGFMYAHGIYFNKNPEKGFEWYTKAANNENHVAQYLLANMYQTGKGTKHDIDSAIYYYTKSAKANYQPAEVALGFMYEIYKHNYTKALKWYSKAAKSNNPYAFYNLGILYEYGKGVPQNTQKAFAWFQKSALKGYTTAELKIANMYLNGNGVSENAKTAMKWYQKSALKNNPTALYQLGLMNETGVGCDINLDKAKAFYTKAADLGNMKSQLALARINNNDKYAQVRYYREAAENGNAYAKYKLSTLSQNSETSKIKIDPNYCIKDPNKDENSFFSKVGNIFASTPKKAYMSALNDLNQGLVTKGTQSLEKIIKDNPGYTEAKQSLLYYVCPTPVVVSTEVPEDKAPQT